MAYPYLYIGITNGVPPSADADWCNLYDGVFHVLSNWSPSVGRSGDIVTERIPCILRTASAETTREEIVKLESLFKRARDYLGNRSNTQAIVLAYGAEYEPSIFPGLQYSLILDGRVHYSTPLGGDAFLNDSLDNLITIEVQRLALWELYISQSPTGTPHTAVSGWGGTVSIAGLDGSQPARIRELEITGESTATFDKVWLGIRAERGGLTDFDPIIEAEDGTVIDTADTSIEVTVTGASNASVMRTDFATDATLIERFEIEMNDAFPSVDEADFIGNYQLMGRIKMSAVGSMGLQIRVGYPGMAKSAYLPLSEIWLESETEWAVVPLGFISLPPFGDMDQASPGTLNRLITMTTFSFYAERLSGSASLDVDGMVLLPTDGMAYIQAPLAGALGNPSNLIIYSRRDGLRTAIFEPDVDGGITLPQETLLQDWLYPGENSIIVAIIHDTASPAVADTYTFASYFNSRAELLLERTV